MRVLVACEFSGVVRDAFIRSGHDAWSCDFLPTENDGPHIQKDVLTVLDDKWDLMIAHPPCTYLTVAANKYYKEEYAHRFPRRFLDREEAIKFFMDLVKAPIDKIAIENPVGVISTRFRKPDQIIQPYEFGHPDRKKTCLWLKNLPLLKPTNIVRPKIKTNKNGKTASVHHDYALGFPQHIRWKMRSKTYIGWAKAMADQWSNIQQMRLF